MTSFSTLGTTIVGNDRGAISYMNALSNYTTKEDDFAVNAMHLPVAATQHDLEQRIRELNESDRIHGMLLMNPTPDHIDHEALLRMISKHKDVDCSHPENYGDLMRGEDVPLPPATALAIVSDIVSKAVPLVREKGLEPHVVFAGTGKATNAPAQVMIDKQGIQTSIIDTYPNPGFNLADELLATEGNIFVGGAREAYCITPDMVPKMVYGLDVAYCKDPKSGKTVGNFSPELLELPGIKNWEIGGLTKVQMANNTRKAAQIQREMFNTGHPAA